MNQVPPEALAKLAVAPLFQEMTEDQIHRYCGGGTWRRLSEGNNLFFKDDPAGMMFVIVEGYFSVEAETSAGIVFLLSPAAAFISGTVMRIDGARPQVRMGWGQVSAPVEAQSRDAVKPFNGFHRYQVPKVFKT